MLLCPGCGVALNFAVATFNRDILIFQGPGELLLIGPQVGGGGSDKYDRYFGQASKEVRGRDAHIGTTRHRTS